MEKPTTLNYSPSKIIATLLASQSLFSAASILTFTVAGIQVVDLAAGRTGWTGVPSTLGLIGAAVISYPIGKLMDSAGRRAGLALGFVFSVLGCVLAGWSLLVRSLPLFLLGAIIFGFGRGAIELGRYAAADAALPAQRGRAISFVVLGGTVGSITGPTLIIVAESGAARLSILPESGPWFLAALLCVIGILLMLTLLRPDPRDIGREIARQLEAQSPSPAAVETATRTFGEVMQESRARLALGAMVFSQLAMVIVMTITPVHMRAHDHALSAVSWVIMAHTMGMFGTSYFSGWLADRIGRSPVILAGGALLIVACAIAPLSTTMLWLAIALFLLGFGWSLCFVAGSALLDEVLRANEKGRIQGAVDAMVKVSSGAGSLGSGVMFAASSFALTSWITLTAAVVPVLLVLVLSLQSRAVKVPSGAAGE